MGLRRIMRGMGAELRAVLRGGSPVHAHLRDILVGVLVATLGVDLICAALAYPLERHAPGTQIHTFGDAIFWTSTQLLTVSSQLPNPFTTGGRILDVFMEVYAISVASTLAGSMGAFILRRAHQIELATQRAGE